MQALFIPPIYEPPECSSQIISDICRRIFPAVTPGPDQPNVLLAWPDSRSHGEYITHESVWGRTMRHNSIQTLGMMSSQHFLNPFLCCSTIYEIKLLGTQCVANVLPNSILNFILRSTENEGSNRGKCK